MTVQSSVRLSIASTTSFYDWENPFQKSLLKGYDERSVLTERRRVMVGDIAGGRRPLHFIANTPVTAPRVTYMPASRHEMTLKLRRLERRVLFWRNFWDTVFSVVRFRK